MWLLVWWDCFAVDFVNSVGSVPCMVLVGGNLLILVYCLCSMLVCACFGFGCLGCCGYVLALCCAVCVSGYFVADWLGLLAAVVCWVRVAWLLCDWFDFVGLIVCCVLCYDLVCLLEFGVLLVFDVWCVLLFGVLWVSGLRFYSGWALLWVCCLGLLCGLWVVRFVFLVWLLVGGCLR